MLFNSYEFLFFFLPLTLGAWLLLMKRNRQVAMVWLFAASLFFYGSWSWKYIGLLLGSIIFNYRITKIVLPKRDEGRFGRKLFLGLGIAINLIVLGYFKYANFFIGTISESLGLGLSPLNIILPIGISFYTFTQIAYIADAYKGETHECNFVNYGLFVTYFPHLIAGPILHHKEMMPQFLKPSREQSRIAWFSVGLTIFFIGLAKKVIIADEISLYANAVFKAAESGKVISFMEGWGGALSYTLQLYYDFSGYSDMAVGLSLLFGVRLPANFDSPYKAKNITEFWRRWHITLSRFLKDYLYIPLGGSQKGSCRRYINLIVTMLLGGLWHGAGWNFVLWGGLHGVYLVINHVWKAFCGWIKWEITHPLWGWASQLMTFCCVVVAWVFFRASDFDSAISVLKGMGGLNGVVLPGHAFSSMPFLSRLREIGISFGDTGQHFYGPAELLWIVGGLGVAWLFPNTNEIFRKYSPVLMSYKGQSATRTRIVWSPNPLWAITTVVLATVCILQMTNVSSFLYFQF